MATKKEPMPPNRIAEWRGRRNMTQQQLADQLGVHWITISKLERGKIKLTTERMGELAIALGIEPKDLLENYALTQEVGISGYILNGTTIKPLDEDVWETIETEDTDPVSTISNEYLRVIGTDLEPFYYNGDIIQVTYYLDDALPYLVGRLARILLNDERVIFAVLDRHIEANKFDIRTTKGQIFQNVEVATVAVITGHLVKLLEDPRKIANSAIVT